MHVFSVVRMISARLARGIALSATMALWSSPALAGEPEATDPQVVDAARFDFTEGTAHFQAKRWADALKAFEHSYSLVPSPNTSLMIARCLRELGRRADAANAYANAAAEAHRRVTAGEGKYKQTAETATTEGGAVRAQLGTIHVHVARPTGATLTVDKKVVELSKDGDATILHDPGTASVTVSDATGAEQRQTVTVQPNTTVQMDFAVSGGSSTQLSDRPPPPPPPPPERSAPSWPVPAALVAGGVAIAGLGVFIGFGASSQATYDTLAARCGPASCGPADRDEAQAGERNQTIANIGLGVSAVAAVATIVLAAVALTSGDRAQARAPSLFDPSRPGPL